MQVIKFAPKKQRQYSHNFPIQKSVLRVLRRNPLDVGVTSGQKSCTKIIYIVLQTSVGLF